MQAASAAGGLGRFAAASCRALWQSRRFPTSQIRSFTQFRPMGGVVGGQSAQSGPLYLATNVLKGQNALPASLQAPFGMGDIIIFNSSGMINAFPALSFPERTTVDYLLPTLKGNLSQMDGPEDESTQSILAIKRTYQPSTLKRKRRHGFRFVLPSIAPRTPKTESEPTGSVSCAPPTSSSAASARADGG
jgi:hypothetical protein